MLGSAPTMACSRRPGKPRRHRLHRANSEKSAQDRFVSRALLCRAQSRRVHAAAAPAGRDTIVLSRKGLVRGRRALRRRPSPRHDPSQSANPRDRRRASDRRVGGGRRAWADLARRRRRQHSQPDRQLRRRYRSAGTDRYPPTVNLAGLGWNLLWVTIGNTISGAGIMGLGYWAASRMPSVAERSVQLAAAE